MRIAALSDMHGCAETFAVALKQARTSGYDVLLILGDLLTYGVEPQRLLDLANDAVNDGAIFILGNHDQIYIDQKNGGSTYAEALPDWIKESVVWTRDQIGTIDYGKLFDWRASWSEGDLFAAHANPFDYGDWTYLSTDASFVSAAETLANRGFTKGLFGHTHRFRSFEDSDLNTKIITVGSLGQPRDRQRQSEWAILDLESDKMHVTRQPLEISWESQLAAISATDLTEKTKIKLSEFFLPC